MQNIILILTLWLIFSNSFKVVDLIDEHKWIEWKKWFIIKYFFAILTVISVYLTLKLDNNFIIHFSSIFLFWIIKNKMEFPSHVLIMFFNWILLWYFSNFSFNTISLIVIFLFLYLIIDYIIGNFKKNKIISYFFYKRLGRFYIIALFLSIYLNDYYIILHSAIWLLSMEIIRLLISKNIIKIKQ